MHPSKRQSINQWRRNTYAVLLLVVISISSYPSFADRKSSSGKTGDFQAWDKGDKVRIYLNWQSFADLGFPSEWEVALPNAIRGAITRWEQIGGFDLNPTYSGFTDSVSFPNDNKVVIRALDIISGTKAVGEYKHDQGVILIGRKKSTPSGSVNIKWVLSQENNDEDSSIFTTILHELGHVWGLRDNNADAQELDSVMGYGSKELHRHGPFIDDIDTLLELYGPRNNLSVRLMRSTDDGISWSDKTVSIAAISTLPLSVNRDDDGMIIFFRDYKNRPAWLFGNSNATSFVRRPTSYGTETSLYSTTGHGYDGEMMMAWVDPYAGHEIRLMYSDDGGSSYKDSNLPASYATGSVGLRKVDDNTWVLAYPRLNSGDYTQSGTVVSRISTDDGKTWSSEKVIKDNYVAASGVTLADKGPNDIRVGFSYLSNDANKFMGLRTFITHIQNGNLKWDKTVSNNTSIANVDYSFTASDDYFFVGRRTTGADINVGRSAETANSWGNFVYLDDERNPLVGPGCTARKNSQYVYCFYTDD